VKNLDREIIIASILAFLLIVLAIAVPVLTGSTFGQRCAKAYPDDPARQERCIERAAQGGYIYPEPSSEGSAR